MDPAQIVYLNGEFPPLTEAKISVLDRGFLFGDGVYEVIPFYDSTAIGLTEHLVRLQKSLDAIRLPLKVDQEKFQEIFLELLKKNHAQKDAYSIYVQITRGAAPERNHAFPKPTIPTIFAIIKKIPPLSYDNLKTGRAAIVREDIRWKHCHIKSISLLPSILLFQEALDAGAHETILVRDGLVLEGTSSNVFIVKNQTIKTPPLSEENLSGVTRGLIFQIAKENGISISEKTVTYDELKNADEVWISSSTRGIFPITKLDGVKVGNGLPGPIWEKMIKLYLKKAPPS